MQHRSSNRAQRSSVTGCHDDGSFQARSSRKIANDDQILDLSSANRVTGHTRFGNVEKNQDLYNLSMSIFMVKTDWLIEALKEGESIGMPASIEEFLIEQLGRVDTYAYEYSGYLSNIYNMKSYYDANMDMLDPENFNSLLFSSQKVITRTKNERVQRSAQVSWQRDASLTEKSITV